MDRQIVYPGSIPLDTDLLLMQRHVMTAIGALARCVLGTGVVADGLPCVPAATGYGVVVGPGSLSTLYQVDAQPFGSLPANPTPLVRIARNSADTPLELHGPPDGQHALCWLVQAAISEYDAAPVALPYHNAANPAVPWSGPLNNGQAQNTRRLLRVGLSAKPGQPQEVGGRHVPDADDGWIGLYSVMTYFGRGTAPVDIAPVPGGPFVPFKLPSLFPGFSRMEAFKQTTVWRPPPDVRSAKVRLVAAGGGGGGGDVDYAGGGGGAGGYAEAVVSFDPGSTLTVTVGVGGAGGVPRYNGQPGSATVFASPDGTLASALGGSGGHSGNPDSTGGNGGVGTAGILLLTGGPGGDGPISGAVPGGTGGASAFGGGGRSTYGGGPAAVGQAAGSGGAGGYGPAATGAKGANGLVIVEY